MYEDINEMLDGDIDVTKKYYNQVGRFYDMYHNTLVKLNHLEASLVDDEPGPLNIPDSAVEYNGHYYYLCCNNEAEDYATAGSKAVTWQQLHLRKKINFYLIM